MFGSLLSLLVASVTLTGALPGAKPPLDASDDAMFHLLERRGIFGPISTDSPAGIAGGQVACGAPPVSSFFAGLKPPVRKISRLS
jgi:endo-1,3(4)-beta-glucanase